MDPPESVFEGKSRRVTRQSDIQDVDAGDAGSPYQTPARIVESESAPRIGRLRQTLSRMFRGHRFRIAGAWLLAAIVSLNHPGDEYGLFFVATGLPILWLTLILKNSAIQSNSQLLGFAIVFCGGFCTMYGLGALLDMAQIRFRYWFVFTCTFFGWLLYTAISRFPTYAKAISKNGSIHAYWSATLSVSLVVVSVALLLLTIIWRLVNAEIRRGRA